MERGEGKREQKERTCGVQKIWKQVRERGVGERIEGTGGCILYVYTEKKKMERV